MRLISKRKIEEFSLRLKEEKIDSAVFLCLEPGYDLNIEYLTGLGIDRGGTLACLIFSKGKFTLAVSGLEYEQALREAQVDEIIELGRNLRLRDILNEKIKRGSVVGINSMLLPYGASKILPKSKFKDIERICDDLRSVKEPKEIEAIKRACSITNKGISFIENKLKPKMSEKEFALDLENFLKRSGAEDMSFKTIVTSGKRSSLVHPHPAATDARITKGFGLVDFGVIYKGYCSDVTVPFSIGKLNEKQKKIVELIGEALEKSVETAEIGEPTWKINEAAEKVLKMGGFELEHCIGHGIGLMEHDSPYVGPMPANKKLLKKWKAPILKENMVIALEPGIYLRGKYGSRLENDYLVTKSGLDKLTSSRFISVQ